MKILYLHQYFKFPHESGGTRSYDISIGLINSGHHVELLASTSDRKYDTDKRWMRIKKNGLKVHYIYLPYNNNMSYFKRSIIFLKFLWFSSIKLLSLKGDVVLASSTPLTIGIPALIKKWIHKTPFIFEARDIWPEAVIAIGAIKNKIFQKILFFLEYLIYINAKAIIPLSVDMEESIIRRYPKLSNKPITVIENISEMNRFQSGYNKEISILKKNIGFHPRFSILYAGTFGYVNGINYVIEFASKLIKEDPSIIFILIGDGVEKKEVINLAIERQVLNKNVYILDSVSKDDLPQFYNECDMGSSFVLPIKELWANSANKFFDSLASARPILINYGGWQKEVIINENIGFVLPIEITDNAVREFINYSQDKSLIKNQKENALKKAESSYSIDVVLKKYIRILEDII